MAIQYQVRQVQSADPDHPDIPLSITSTAIQSAGTSIQQAGSAPPPTSTPILPTTSPLSSPPVSAAPAASSTSAAAHVGLPPKTTKIIIAVVVPVAVLLIIPLLYLLYRSHKIKKNAEKASSQRNSREAMLAKETGESKSTGPPPPRPPRTPMDTKAPPTPRPTNSLGLFNFDFSTPSSPTGQQTPPRLSLARTLHFRRSDASAINQDRKSQHRASEAMRDPLRNNPTNAARDSSTIVYSEAPPPPYIPPTAAPDSHFAPLNAIGTAIGPPNRPKPTRNPSSGNSIPQSQYNISRSVAPQPPPKGPMGQPPLPTAPPRVASASRKSSSSDTRNLNPPTSAYNMSKPTPNPPQLPSIITTDLPTSSSAPQPVSPINSSSSNYRLPSFGLGMGGRFTLSDYERRRSGNSSSEPSGGNNIHTHRNDRVSDVSGLSVDPEWLSQDERERRGQSRTSTSSDGIVSPVESRKSTSIRRKN